MFGWLKKKELPPLEKALLESFKDAGRWEYKGDDYKMSLGVFYKYYDTIANVDVSYVPKHSHMYINNLTASGYLYDAFTTLHFIKMKEDLANRRKALEELYVGGGE